MGKIRNMNVKTPPIWHKNITQECFLKDHYLISASLHLLRNFAIECYLPLKCSFFSVHFNEIITQSTNMTWKILSFFLDSDGANSKITLSKWWVFSYHISPIAWFLQRLTLNSTYQSIYVIFVFYITDSGCIYMLFGCSH